LGQFRAQAHSIQPHGGIGAKFTDLEILQIRQHLQHLERVRGADPVLRPRLLERGVKLRSGGGMNPIGVKLASYGIADIRLSFASGVGEASMHVGGGL